MGNRRQLSLTLITLLSLAVILQGVVMTVPHDHDLGPRVVELCVNLECPAPNRAHVDHVKLSGSEDHCLACSIGPINLDGPRQQFRDQPFGSYVSISIEPGARLSLHQQWTPPHRGPPQST